jgi:hypothetical protein
MSKPDHSRSAQLFTAAERLRQLSTAAQESAMRAEDALTALEDREARRAIRTVTQDPRMQMPL